MIVYSNNGPEIASTNFWETEFGKRHFAVSVNAGCLRLLVPNCHLGTLPDMIACEFTIASRLRSIRPMSFAMEILFEDHSQSPYCLHLSPETFLGFFPLADERLIERKLSIWTEGVKKVAEMRLFIRYAPRLPWLKPL